MNFRSLCMVTSIFILLSRIFAGGVSETVYPVDPINTSGEIERIIQKTSAKFFYSYPYKLEEFIFDRDTLISFHGIGSSDYELETWYKYKNNLLIDKKVESIFYEYKDGKVVSENIDIDHDKKIEFLPEQNLLINYNDNRSRKIVYLNENNDSIRRKETQYYHENNKTWNNSLNDYSTLYYEYDNDGRLIRNFYLIHDNELHQNISYYDGLNHEIPDSNISTFTHHNEFSEYHELVSEIKSYSPQGKIQYIVQQEQLLGDRLEPESLDDYLENEIITRIFFNDKGNPYLERTYNMNGEKIKEYCYEYTYDEIGNWIELNIYRVYKNNKEIFLNHFREIEYN